MLYQLSYGTIHNCGAKVVSISRTTKVSANFFSKIAVFSQILGLRGASAQ